MRFFIVLIIGLQPNLLWLLQIPGTRYIWFNSNPEDPKLKCENIQDKLDHENPIDLSISGLLMKGHLAFNEPAIYLQLNCHSAESSEMSLQHTMASEMKTILTYGLTLGSADVLK